MTRLFRKVSGPALMAAVLLASPVRAQNAVSVADFVPAEMLDAVKPVYPFVARARGREGWVMLSYVISETGEVTEPMIEDSSGSKHFEESALKAVREWRFKPATSGGAPVAQSMTRTRIVFARPDGYASNEFIQAYYTISHLLDERDFAAAGRRIDQLESEERRNLWDDSGFWWLKYKYLKSTESTDDVAMIDALQHALGYEQDYLPAGPFVAAVAALYDKYVHVSDLSSAIRTFDRLKGSKIARLSQTYEDTVARLEAANLEIQARLASPDPLRMNGRIGQHEYWVHDLLRRSFSVMDVQGEIVGVDIRCEKGTRLYSALRHDLTWTIPASWGACGVYVKGTIGTSFAFEEYLAARRAGRVIDPAAAAEGE